MGLLFITLIGTFLRLIAINKTQGLWNDEYVSWMIAATPFSDGFVNAIKAQCHMPLYYFYLKSFMAFFGQSDLALRISSVIPGVLGIVAMYFVGCQKDKKTGLVAALITALSSFAIYYSQEVRIYSLLFLISALSLLYCLRFIKDKNFSNLLGLIVFDFMIIFTHTIGFVFVFFQLVALSVLMFKDYKKQLAILWGSIVVFMVLMTPAVIHILGMKTFSQWWGSFSFSKIVFLFTDYFSPVLTNLVNAPDKVFYIQTPGFILFTFIPTLLAVSLMINSFIKRDKVNLSLTIPVVGTVGVLAVAAILGKLVFITKYSIEIYPILIYLVAFGVTAFEKKFVGNILIALFVLINATYLVISPTPAPKIPRLQGHKLVTDMINRANPEKGDIIILQYYGADRFGKYFDFSDYTVIPINKANFFEFLAPNIDYAKVYSEGKTILRDVFEEKNTGYFEQVLASKTGLSRLKPGQSIIAISADSVAIYSPDSIRSIASDNLVYERTPIMYMAFSYVKTHVVSALIKDLAVTRAEKSGDWSLIKFTKVNNSRQK